jgi:hypothetical protein
VLSRIHAGTLDNTTGVFMQNLGVLLAPLREATTQLARGDRPLVRRPFSHRYPHDCGRTAHYYWRCQSTFAQELARAASKNPARGACQAGDLSRDGYYEKDATRLSHTRLLARCVGSETEMDCFAHWRVISELGSEGKEKDL